MVPRSVAAAVQRCLSSTSGQNSTSTGCALPCMSHFISWRWCSSGPCDQDVASTSGRSYERTVSNKICGKLHAKGFTSHARPAALPVRHSCQPGVAHVKLSFEDDLKELLDHIHSTDAGMSLGANVAAKSMADWHVSSQQQQDASAIPVTSSLTASQAAHPFLQPSSPRPSSQLPLASITEQWSEAGMPNPTSAIWAPPLKVQDNLCATQACLPPAPRVTEQLATYADSTLNQLSTIHDHGQPPPDSCTSPLASCRLGANKGDSVPTPAASHSESLTPAPLADRPPGFGLGVTLMDVHAAVGHRYKFDQDDYTWELCKGAEQARFSSSNRSYTEELQRKVERQLMREADGCRQALYAYRKELILNAHQGDVVGLGSVPTARLLAWAWIEAVSKALLDLRDKVARNEVKLPCSGLKRVLNDLEPREVADAVVGGTLKATLQGTRAHKLMELGRDAAAISVVEAVSKRVQDLVFKNAAVVYLAELKQRVLLLQRQRNRSTDTKHSSRVRPVPSAADSIGTSGQGGQDMAEGLAQLSETPEDAYAQLKEQQQRIRQALCGLQQDSLREVHAATLRKIVPLVSTWSKPQRIKVGAALVALLLEHARLPPSFRTERAAVQQQQQHHALLGNFAMLHGGLAGSAQHQAQQHQLPQDSVLCAPTGAAAEAQQQGQKQPWLQQYAPSDLMAHRMGTHVEGTQRMAEAAQDPAAWFPAFTHQVIVTAASKTSPKSSRNLGVIQVHDQVLQVLQGSEELYNWLSPVCTPMVVEPLTWSSLNCGGHLTYSTSAIKVINTVQGAHLRKAERQGLLVNLFDGLTSLGSVPWRINAAVLDVHLSLLATVDDELAAKLGLPLTIPNVVPLACPQATPWLRLARSNTVRGSTVALLVTAGPPTKPERKDLHEEVTGGPQRECMYGPSTLVGVDKLALVRPRRPQAHSKAKRKRYNAFAMRIAADMKLSIAKDLRDEDKIYFPHSVDFRGRAYPLHGHLSHQSNDVARGMLQFGEARRLGPSGLRWLFIHAANLWGRGEDKRTLPEREAFGRRHLAHMQESAANPMAGNPWWQDAEKPWQMLALCMEMAAAHAHPEGPEEFFSHVPVHQDGACNGLQHYAALGRDLPGGRAVCLVPADAPQDVYMAVCKVVAKRVKQEAAAGSEAARSVLKHYGDVDRKLVKQSIMTTVYGVTQYGIGEQIRNRLVERGWGVEQQSLTQAAHYLAKVTTLSLGEVFSSARCIMDWLSVCASVVTKAGHVVAWSSPVGFPIMQHYRRERSQQVATTLQYFRLPASTKETDPVDTRKQCSAFPPNFVHSLDAAHQLMTAVACREAGLAFAGVHDSYWTHAADVDTMNRILREKFIELHSYPLLHALLKELQEAHPDLADQFPPVPPIGDLDIEQVRQSTYFFS